MDMINDGALEPISQVMAQLAAVLLVCWLSIRKNKISTKEGNPRRKASLVLTKLQELQGIR